MSEILTLTINGEPTKIPAPSSIADLLRTLAYEPGGHLAVAVNHAFVPRAEHPHVLIQDGDEVEVVAPMQGG